MDDSGRLSGPELVCPGGNAYRTGDRVVTFAPGPDGSLVTSQRAVVEVVDPSRGTVTLRTDDGHEVRLGGDDAGADRLGYGYATTVTNATQTVFARQSPWGVGSGLVEWDAEVNVDLPSVEVDGFDEEADEALALVEVELVDAVGDLGGEFVDAAAELVVGGELVSLGLEVVAVVGEFFAAAVGVGGAAGEFVGVDDSGLVHVRDAAAFGVGGVDASLQPAEFGGEELVVGGGCAVCY